MVESRLEGNCRRSARPKAFGVLVDECGTHVSLAPIYGYSPMGERVRLKVPRNRGENTTLLARSMSTEGMGPCLAVEGSTNAEVFEAYLEHSIAPELKEGRVLW
jgi:hypothetical protein